ncbi:MAG TPA: hypothetical protein VHD87_15355 [Acidimicrobiales bacterium]|nr:hypothetical protein [Acidimicrobiales bacterium]
MTRNMKLMIGLLVALLLFAGPGRITLGMRSHALKQASDAKAETARVKERLALANVTQAHRSELAAKLADIEARLPSLKELPGYIDAVGQAVNGVISWDAGTTADAAAPGPAGVTAAAAPAPTPTPTGDTSPVAGAGGLGTVAISITTTGTYQDLANALEQIRAMTRLVVIDTVAWQNGNGTLVGRAFYFTGAPVPDNIRKLLAR